MEKDLFKVCITGAAGSLAYSFIPMLISGQVFGPRTSIYLTLLDVPSQEPILKGLVLELEDGAFTLLHKVEYGTNPREMFAGCDLVIFLGGAARRPGQERRDLLKDNGMIFKEHGEALNEVCKDDCKCLVVANPCHTNCYILRKHCPKLPNENFHALSRLDHNRAVTKLAQRLDIPITKVKKMTIWGNHSSLQYPDLSYTEVDGKRVTDIISDENYIKNDFLTLIQQRGAMVLRQRDRSAVVSGARAILGHLRDWFYGTEEGDWTSMGIVSDGSYGVPEGLVFSFPVTCKNFKHKIVDGLEMSEFSKEQLQGAIDDLIDEREEAVNEYDY